MDWTDPETWKLPASLVDYWKTIIVGSVAILGAISTLIRWGLRPFQWAWSKIAGRKAAPLDLTPMPPTPEKRRGPVGIKLGPGARGNEFVNTRIRGMGTAIENEGEDNKFRNTDIQKR